MNFNMQEISAKFDTICDLINIFPSRNLLTISRQTIFAHFMLNIGKICNHQISENEITIIVKFYERRRRNTRWWDFIIRWLVSASLLYNLIFSSVSSASLERENCCEKPEMDDFVEFYRLENKNFHSQCCWRWWNWTNKWKKNIKSIRFVTRKYLRLSGCGMDY